MARFSRADEVVIRDIEPAPRICELRCDGVAEFLWGLACGICSLADFETVFVGAGEVHDIVAEKSVPTAEGIADNGRIRMTEVRFGIDVIDRGGDVKTAHTRDATGVAMLRLGMRPDALVTVGSTTMSHNFAEATSVQRSISQSESGGIVYDGMVYEGWDILGNTNGGYLMAMAARAMADAAGRPPMTVTAHYLSPGAVGPHIVEVTEVRAGRRFATMTGAVINVETGREVIRVLGTFGHHDTDAVERLDGAPPSIPAYDDCPVDVNGDDPDAQPVPELQQRLSVRLAPGSVGFRSGKPRGVAEVSGWFDFADGQKIDEYGLILASDSFPPAVFNSGLPVSWVPTVELTVHLRGLPVPGPLAVVFRTRFVSGGVLEEDGEVWDSAGHLVAQSRQLALTPRPS